MKANEAPTKLYVNTNDHLTRNGFYAFTENNRKDSVEYTRTDAFVEKASEYLNKSCQRFILTEKDIEEFKKYMEGE